MKLLIIGFVWPEPDSSAAGSRMMQLIEIFFEQGVQITFASASAAGEHTANLDDYGIDRVAIKINSSDFDHFIVELQPDIVLFDRFMTEEQFGWRVMEKCPDAMRILDTEDLHSLRKVRQEMQKSANDFTVETWMEADITKREIASIYRCDLSLIISEYEMELLRNSIKIDASLLHYLPLFINAFSNKEKEHLPLFEKRKHFITIGNFRHDPNFDSVCYLKESIWPLVREKLPSAEIHVYGSYSQEKVTALNDIKGGFIIKGRAASSKQVMQNARVCLAPLRFGAGLKGKFIEAMQCGTPSVTTAIGAEGLSGELPFGGCIEDAPDEIANCAFELYTDKSKWKQKQSDGFKLLSERFLRSNFENDLFAKIMKLKSNLISHRSLNFIGSMLQYQGLHSTKYMSKWIEAKNKSGTKKG